MSQNIDKEMTPSVTSVAFARCDAPYEVRLSESELYNLQQEILETECDNYGL